MYIKLLREGTYESSVAARVLFTVLLIYSVLRSQETWGAAGAEPEVNIPFVLVVEVGSASMNASLGSMGGRLFGSGFNSI